MTVCTIITSCLYKKSKHFSILTDVIYKKELSLCINLLFFVLSFGFFFSLNTSMVGAICFRLNCCSVCFPFFHMVLEVEELIPQHGAGSQCCLQSSKAPPGVGAIHIQMGKGLLFFQVPHWFGGSFVATAVACQLPGSERPMWLIPSQRKTCQLLCKETWGCVRECGLGQYLLGWEKKSLFLWKWKNLQYELPGDCAWKVHQRCHHCSANREVHCLAGSFPVFVLSWDKDACPCLLFADPSTFFCLPSTEFVQGSVPTGGAQNIPTSAPSWLPRS